MGKMKSGPKVGGSHLSLENRQELLFHMSKPI